MRNQYRWFGPLWSILKGSIRGLFLFAVIQFLFIGCTKPIENEYSNAKRELEQKSYDESLKLFERVIKRDPQSKLALSAAKESAQILQFQLKNYDQAIEFYSLVVLHSNDDKERILAERTIADIYFENLQNYQKAIEYYSKLIYLNLEDRTLAQIRLNLARSNFYQNNFFQAESEVQALEKLKIAPDIQFEGQMIRSSIFLARKEYEKSIELFKGLLKDSSVRAIDSHIPFTLAICYEELNNYKQAIQVLESYRDNYPTKKDYIELRIKRLTERMKNLPGARGLRK